MREHVGRCASRRGIPDTGVRDLDTLDAIAEYRGTFRPASRCRSGCGARSVEPGGVAVGRSGRASSSTSSAASRERQHALEVVERQLRPACAVREMEDVPPPSARRAATGPGRASLSHCSHGRGIRRAAPTCPRRARGTGSARRSAATPSASDEPRARCQRRPRSHAPPPHRHGRRCPARKRRSRSGCTSPRPRSRATKEAPDSPWARCCGPRR